jgi:hypothetical protein
VPPISRRSWLTSLRPRMSGPPNRLLACERLVTMSSFASRGCGIHAKGRPVRHAASWPVGVGSPCPARCVVRRTRYGWFPSRIGRHQRAPRFSSQRDRPFPVALHGERLDQWDPSLGKPEDCMDVQPRALLTCQIATRRPQPGRCRLGNSRIRDSPARDTSRLVVTGDLARLQSPTSEMARPARTAHRREVAAPPTAGRPLASASYLCVRSRVLCRRSGPREGQ